MNKHNTNNVLRAIHEGNLQNAIDLLASIPYNHKRYALLYHQITMEILLGVQNIGPINSDIWQSFQALPYPYVFTWKYIRKLKGGVIKDE